MLDPKTARRVRASICGISAVLLLANLAGNDLWAPDEPRLAQVADELRALERGPVDLVLLRLNGEIYTQKPPLYYWLAAALGAPGGRVGEAAARLPSALAGIACIALCMQLARTMTRRDDVALWSGVLLLSVYRFSHFARRAQLDVMLTCFFVLALLAFWQLYAAEGHKRIWGWLLHASLGLALLTKGPVGLLPIPIILIFLVWERRLSSRRQIFHTTGWLATLGPAVVWISLAIALAPTGFFSDAIVDNLIGRFVSGTAHVRPFYYYAYHFPLEFMPWTLLWPLAAWQAWRHLGAAGEDTHDRSATRLLVVWVVFLFVFFSISAGKRGTYLLPAFPAAAILSGWALRDWLARRDRLPVGLLVGVAALASALLVVGVGSFFLPELELARYPGFRLPPAAAGGLAILGLTSFMGIVVLAARVESVSHQMAWICGSILLLELLVYVAVYPAFDSEKSPRPVAEAARRHTPMGSRVGLFDHPEMTGGIAYYSGRRVAELGSLEALTNFFDEGGRVVIVRRDKLDSLRRFPGLTRLDSIRSGDREVLLLGPPKVDSKPRSSSISEPESTRLPSVPAPVTH